MKTRTQIIEEKLDELLDLYVEMAVSAFESTKSVLLYGEEDEDANEATNDITREIYGVMMEIMLENMK